MKKILCFIAIIAMLAGCATTAKTYNATNYPDSIVITAFERVNVNPEAFAARILRVVNAEIAYGRFTRDQVIRFVDEYIGLVQAGMLPYDAIRDVIERYGHYLLMQDKSNVSEAAIIAYSLLMPDLSAFNVKDPVGPDDTKVVTAFLQYIRNGV